MTKHKDPFQLKSKLYIAFILGAIVGAIIAGLVFSLTQEGEFRGGVYQKSNKTQFWGDDQAGFWGDSQAGVTSTTLTE